MTSDIFVNRHIGPRDHELPGMLETIGVNSLDDLIDKAIPRTIRLDKPIRIPKAMTEFEYLKHIKALGAKNKMFRSFIGQGYYGVALLSVIVRNVLENPSWYTSYTPYQAEISQGRLEALLNFQTMVIELTGMQIANASLLDESTAAAEAMIMVFWAFVQYPAASGQIRDYMEFAAKAHAAGALVGVAADLMSLAILTPPGEWGADIVVGSNQRFGLPMSFGGPHAGYFATRDELKRSMPGRIIGVSIDAQGNTALRMALQTREQHIKRERATSNICTAQALLATMSGMYAQYHGPEGLKSIATHIHKSANTLSEAIRNLGYRQSNSVFFD